MHKFLMLTACILLILTPALLAGDGNEVSNSKGNMFDRNRNGSEMDEYASELINEYASELQDAMFDFESSDPDKETLVDGCVEIDIDLPDSVEAGENWGSPLADGYFELVNCSSMPALLWLTLELSVSVDGVIDTTIVLPSFPLFMTGGMEISYEFPVPVPPYAGIYSVCVTAENGDSVVTDCATMIVYEEAENPGVAFEGCGLLYDVSGCMTFTPLYGDTLGYDVYTIENYDGFDTFDTVYVSGTLYVPCDDACGGAVGCIVDNTVDSCGSSEPTGVAFEGCGLLYDVSGCMTFTPLYGDTLDYDVYTIENYDGFDTFDTVYVSGTLYIPCDDICGGAVGCIVDNTVDSCGSSEPTGVAFEGCGLLYDVSGCMTFTPLYGDTLGYDVYTIENYDGFDTYDTVYVSGTLYIPCDDACGGAVGCIVDNTVDSCGSSEPTEVAFEGCGLLYDISGCMTFTPLYGDTLGYDVYTIENYDGFDTYDTVYVSGTLYIPCDDACGGAVGCIVDNTVDSCGSSEPKGVAFEGCGLLYDVSGCMTFTPLYGDTLGYDVYTIENYDGFDTFDTVYVSGTLYIPCDDACGGAVGCIVDNTVESCGFEKSGPTGVVAVQNYPNPFNPTTTIELSIPQPAKVTVTIYNILGQVVTTLVDAHLGAGTHQFEWNSSKSRAASGIYFYRVQAGDVDLTKKMLLMK